MRHIRSFLAVTEAGSTAGAALAAGLAAFERAPATGGSPAGHVAFGYFTTLGPQYVPGILQRMARLHPQVKVTPVEADLDEMNQLLEAGRIELALSYDVEIGSHIATETVAELRPYALLPDRHSLRRQPEVTPAELAAEPFILVDLPLSRDFLLSVFRAEGIEPRIAHGHWKWCWAWLRMDSASRCW